MTAFRIVLSACLVLALAACGMKGDLYLPGEAEASADAARPLPGDDAVDDRREPDGEPIPEEEPAPGDEPPGDDGRKTIPRAPDPALSH